MYEGYTVSMVTDSIEAALACKPEVKYEGDSESQRMAGSVAASLTHRTRLFTCDGHSVDMLVDSAVNAVHAGRLSRLQNWE